MDSVRPESKQFRKKAPTGREQLETLLGTSTAIGDHSGNLDEIINLAISDNTRDQHNDTRSDGNFSDDTFSPIATQSVEYGLDSLEGASQNSKFFYQPDTGLS